MSKIHVIKQVQRLPVPVEEAWSFFSSPNNLNKLTPAKLGLKITSAIDAEEIHPGQIITYTVKPLLGIPMFWMTEITHMERHKLFVDEQRKGPYALWHHEHHFKAIQGGTEMTDIVHYKIPFGVLGALGTSVVKGELKKIFDYRLEQINTIFGAF
jgi:ligand-binding SRPBCC domain-containing protein